MPRKRFWKKPRAQVSKRALYAAENDTCEMKTETKVDELSRWPPDITVPAHELRPVLTCGLCNKYFYNATTITECLHTFCKSCIVRHVCTSLHCPTCRVLIHPTDPFVHLRLDSTMQDIVYKMLPHTQIEQKKQEKEFYESRGLPYPPPEYSLSRSLGRKGVKTKTKARVVKPPEFKKLVSVLLEYAGTAIGLGSYKPLAKKYLLIPEYTSVGSIQKFIAAKLKVEDSDVLVCIFIGFGLLHDTVTMKQVKENYFDEDVEVNVIELQYGMVRKRNYFDENIISDTTSIQENSVPRNTTTNVPDTE